MYTFLAFFSLHNLLKNEFLIPSYAEFVDRF